MTGPISLVARTAFVVAAVAVFAALVVGAVDAAMRFLLRNPIASAHELVEIAMTIAFAFGAPAALYLHRDRTIPGAPAWLGHAGRAACAMLCAAYATFVFYSLAVEVGPKTADQLSITLDWPLQAISSYAVAACFVLVVFLAPMSARGAGPDSSVLPLAVFFGVAALAAWFAHFGTNGIGALYGSRLLGYVTGSAYQAIPVIVGAVIAGAIAALRPGTRIAAIAAPLAGVILVSTLAETSVLRLLLVLPGPMLVMILLHAALGHWRGWSGAVDDWIGLALPIVMGAVLVTGLVTPGEFASIAGLLVLMALIPVALLLRKGDTGSALAVGLAHGIGLIFAFVLLVTLADALLRIVGPGEAIAPLSGRSGVLICLALGIVLGALFGGAVGSVLAALILLVLGGKGSPLTVGYLTVLAALAGGALQPWLSWRLAGRSPPAEAPSFKSALLAALPPALAALALGFFPDLSAVPLQLLD